MAMRKRLPYDASWVGCGDGSVAAGSGYSEAAAAVSFPYLCDLSGDRRLVVSRRVVSWPEAPVVSPLFKGLLRVLPFALLFDAALAYLIYQAVQ